MKLRHVLSVTVLVCVFAFGVTAAFAGQTRKSGQTSARANTKSSSLQTNQVQPTRQAAQSKPTSAFGFAPGQPNFFGGQQPPSNKQHGGPGSSDVCTDGTYLYAVQGSMIHQYAILDMTLVQTVELPTTALSTTDTAATTNTATSTATLPPPPHGAGPGAVCTDGASLYVLRGSVLLQYTLPGLTLANTVELPQPELTTTDAATSTATLPPPPHGAAPSSICINGSSLYVLQGHLMLQYDLSTLTLVTTVELPRPVSPDTTAQE